MNILLLSRCLPYPLHHGDRLIVYHLVRALRARGHQFDLVAFYLEESDLLEIPRLAGIFDHIEPIQERPRSALDYLIRLTHPFPDRVAGCWNPPMWKAVEWRLAQKHYDVVHLFGGIQVYEYRNLVRGLPNIIVPYDSYALFMKRAANNAARRAGAVRLRIVSALAHCYERMIYAGFDRTVLVSEKDDSYLRGLNPGLRTTVIPNGVDDEYFKPVSGLVRASSLVFIGNYDYPPNVAAATALVTEILPRVRREVPEARGILVGPNPPPTLTSLAGDGVKVTGYVPDVRPYLATATCFVAPLTLGSGIRNKILEAMAMRVPVVTTPLGCEGIAVTPDEDILCGHDADELAGAVVRLFRDETLRVRLADGGQRLVHQLYNWQRVAAQYEMLYQDVIAERHARQSR